MEKDHSTLTTQVEYYLSNTNLENDEFFHHELENSAEGYLALDLIMNCNKIKKLSATYADLKDAIANSKILELNDNKDSVRRLDKTLPEFKGKKKFEMATRASRKNSEKSVASKNVIAKNEEEEETSKVFVPHLLIITDVDGLPKNGKLMEETIGEQFKTKVPYARINRSNGHLVFDKNCKDSSEAIEKLLVDGFEFEGKKFEVIASDDRERNLFNKENLAYLEKIVKKKFGKSVKKAGKVVEKKLFVPVTFAGKKYNNFSGLSTQFKNIISKSRNGVEVDEDSSKMVRELLKLHDSSDSKLKDAKSFLVDFHPVYKQTRCFFVVKEDGTKEDFSIHKCLNNLKDKIMSE